MIMLSSVSICKPWVQFTVGILQNTITLPHTTTCTKRLKLRRIVSTVVHFQKHLLIDWLKKTSGQCDSCQTVHWGRIIGRSCPIICSSAPHHMPLHFSTGNAKLNGNTLIFNLPAGKTCPGANICKSMAIQTPAGRKIHDFKNTEFRCFAASSEVQYDGVFANRAENWLEVKSHLHNGNLADYLNTELHKNLKKKHTRVRIHESGDFFAGRI